MRRIGRFTAFTLAVLLASTTNARAELRAPRDIPLIDQRGASFRLTDLAGSVTFVTFVATRCTEICPIANAEFARLDALLVRDRVPATLVTVTLDPTYDTPFVMSRFARLFTTRNRWRFASGDAAEVRALMASLGVAAGSREEGASRRHSSFVYVLDRHARLARTLLLSGGMVASLESAAKAIDARP